MRISIDNRLYMDCPEGFRELTEEERRQMNVEPGSKFLGISNPDKNIVITVTYVRVSELSAWLMGTREAARNMDRQIGRRLKKFSYAWIDDVKLTIDGQMARGIDYEYTSNGINMTGESLVVKIEKDMYYFHMYAKKARRAESLEIFRDILEDIAIVE